MNAYLIANGDRCDDVTLFSALKHADLIIAVDGGLNHLGHLGVMPDVIIGDMDSALAQKNMFKHVKHIKLPTQKNMTDLEYALDYAVDKGAKAIKIYNAFGGRIDHFLTNIGLLHRAYADNDDIIIELIDENQTVRALKPYNVIRGIKGQTFSIVPQTAVKSLSIRGAKYNLDSHDLDMGSSRCQSNIADTDELVIEIDSGFSILTINRLNYNR